ncbi:MAG: hypothetical protein ACPGUY_08355, partial [Akkermansiaceae bacterium]
TVEYLYYVVFRDEAEPKQRYPILMQVVERKGRGKPRVHGDAFIEHYEKRLRKFGEEKAKERVNFHCVVEARTASTSADIPKSMRTEMIRFVVKSHPQGKTAFHAYLNKNSPLMKYVGAGKAYPYTEPKFSTLTFRWNQDNPEKHYIELVDVVSLSWEQ